MSEKVLVAKIYASAVVCVLAILAGIAVQHTGAWMGFGCGLLITLCAIHATSNGKYVCDRCEEEIARGD